MLLLLLFDTLFAPALRWLERKGASCRCHNDDAAPGWWTASNLVALCPAVASICASLSFAVVWWTLLCSRSGLRMRC